MGAKALDHTNDFDKELQGSNNKKPEITSSENHTTAQLTRWRFNGGKWEIIKEDKEGDEYAPPKVMKEDKEGDEYDQKTGRRISAIHQDLWMKSGELESLRDKMQEQIDLWPDIAKDLIAHCEEYPGDLQDGLLDCGKLTFPSDLKFTPEHFSAGEPVIEDELRKRLGDFLISFTKANGQMAYLQSKKWFLDGSYKVVLEVNFYPNRKFNEKSAYLAPHKDTDSRNLFVNLIFNNPTQMPGTEWTMDEFYPDEKRIQELKKHLPQEEIESMFAAKDNMEKLPQDTPGKNNWEGGVVEPYSYASWIDELIWHSTPAINERYTFDKKEVIDWFKNTPSAFHDFYTAIQIISFNTHGKISSENLELLKECIVDKDTWAENSEQIKKSEEYNLYDEILLEIEEINWPDKENVIGWFKNVPDSYEDFYKAISIISNNTHGKISDPNLVLLKEYTKDMSTWERWSKEIPQKSDSNLYQEILQENENIDWPDKKKVIDWFENGPSNLVDLYEAILHVSDNENGKISDQNLIQLKEYLIDLDTWKNGSIRIKGGSDLYQEILLEIEEINWPAFKISGDVGGVEVYKEGGDGGIDTDHRDVPSKVGQRLRSNSNPKVKAENIKALDLMKKHKEALQPKEENEDTSQSEDSQVDELPKRSFIRTWATLVKVKDV